MGQGSADFYVRFVPEDGQKPIIGECTDELHPGKKYPRPAGGYPKNYRGEDIVFGWFQVEKFSFGFDVKVDDEGTKTEKPADKSVGKSSTGQAPHTTTGRAGGKDDDSSYTRPNVSISKHLDSASTTFWLKNCYEGQALKKVEAEACRSGGQEGAVKTPFVRLVFEDVYIETISLSLPEDALPEESLQFSYTRVQMESIWTSNETGERKVGRPRSFGWNFEDNAGWAAD